MSGPEKVKVVGYVLCGISAFAALVWSAATAGFWPDLTDKEARSSWEMHKKYSPKWWQKFSRWLLVGVFVLGVIGYFLIGPDPKQEPRPSLWHQLFGKDK